MHCLEASLVLYAALGNELADLRANQELLQKRINQLSQAPPPGAPGFAPKPLELHEYRSR